MFNSEGTWLDRRVIAFNVSEDLARSCKTCSLLTKELHSKANYVTYYFSDLLQSIFCQHVFKLGKQEFPTYRGALMKVETHHEDVSSALRYKVK